MTKRIVSFREKQVSKKALEFCIRLKDTKIVIVLTTKEITGNFITMQRVV